MNGAAWRGVSEVESSCRCVLTADRVMVDMSAPLSMNELKIVLAR